MASMAENGQTSELTSKPKTKGALFVKPLTRHTTPGEKKELGGPQTGARGEATLSVYSVVAGPPKPTVSRWLSSGAAILPK